MSYRLDFELPGLPKMTNPASGGSRNWRAAHFERQKWKNVVAKIASVRRPKEPMLTARLTLTRFSSTCPDPDGLVSGFKAVIDGLVAGGVLVNDRFQNIGMPTYRWEQVGRGKGKIHVIVEEVSQTKPKENP